MKLRPMIRIFAALTATVSAANVIAGETEFTYQGELKQNDAPANGNFNITFRLYDALSGGNLLGTDTTLGVPVADGLFTVRIDFGGEVFDNSDRWLEIQIGANTLSPRQPITRAPYAITTRGIIVDDDGSVGIGTTNPESRFHVRSPGEYTISALNTDVSGERSGVHGVTWSSSGRGVSGTATSIEGVACGGYFRSASEDGVGVLGLADISGGISFGGIFESASQSGTGVKAHASATSGFNVALQARTDSPNGWAGFFLGGRNYFEGDVGIGVLVPATPMHVDGGTDVSPTGGGYCVFGATNSTNLAFDNNEIMARDAGGASPLFINHNGGDALIAAAGTGNVGIGTTTPSFLLEVDGSAGKPGGGSWSNTSDVRLKRNIANLDSALNSLLQLRGVTFEYIDHKAINELPGQRIGMIAQDVERVFPDWVEERADGYKTVTFRGFEALTVEALRELRAEKDAEIAHQNDQIEALRTENDDLRQRLADLETALTRLEHAVETQSER